MAHSCNALANSIGSICGTSHNHEHLTQRSCLAQGSANVRCARCGVVTPSLPPQGGCCTVMPVYSLGRLEDPVSSNACAVLCILFVRTHPCSDALHVGVAERFSCPPVISRRGGGTLAFVELRLICCPTSQGVPFYNDSEPSQPISLNFWAES